MVTHFIQICCALEIVCFCSIAVIISLHSCSKCWTFNQYITSVIFRQNQTVCHALKSNCWNDNYLWILFLSPHQKSFVLHWIRRLFIEDTHQFTYNQIWLRFCNTTAVRFNQLEPRMVIRLRHSWRGYQAWGLGVVVVLSVDDKRQGQTGIWVSHRYEDQTTQRVRRTESQRLD